MVVMSQLPLEVNDWYCEAYSLKTANRGVKEYKNALNNVCKALIASNDHPRRFKFESEFSGISFTVSR